MLVRNTIEQKNFLVSVEFNKYATFVSNIKTVEEDV